jgi:molybdate transport system ATP-binding protein
MKPDRGRISLNGRCLFDSARGISLPPQQRRVGYVFQNARLFPNLSVDKNLRFGWRRSASRAPESDVARIVDLLGIGPLLRRKPAKLSGGEKSRVALGRALLSGPDILVLDEPLAALDAPRKDEILPYLERLRDETRIPILYISHALEEVARLADRLILLKNGRVAARGSVFGLVTDFAFAEFTGGKPYGTLLDASIVENRTQEGLTLLGFSGGELLVPLLARAEGSRLRVHIRAEDVMVARERPGAISANNVMPVSIGALQSAGDAFVDIRLMCGTTAIVARITRASCNRLALREGESIFAIVKSVTVSPKIDTA